MAEYLAILRDGGWEADDVRAVELAVRKVLVGMLADRDEVSL